jgi:uncharacterized protein
MTELQLEPIENQCEAFVKRQTPADAAHDIDHVRRVVENTRRLTEMENANALVTLPAAWLHDCVAIAKDDPRRSQGSKLAAEAAVRFLAETDYPKDLLDGVRHAIEAHSFSAGIPACSLEAQVVQDADRLDSLGAIGIARCLLVGGRLDRRLLCADDPFCDQREPDDSRYTIDHFYAKLLTLPATMQTAAGRRAAEQRAQVMREYLDTLRSELIGVGSH